ncbi:MAG: acetoacetate--CoA ligase [Sedimentitalea sp.]
MSEARPILWTPPPARAQASTMAQYMRFLSENKGLKFEAYADLWAWSVQDLDGFWQSIWDFFDLRAATPHTAVLQHRALPGAVWFPGATLNFADQILRQGEKTPDALALVVQSETFERRALTWAELRAQVASAAARFQAMGIGQGDRVVAVLPNTETAIIACLAATSLGAIWSLCAPDMGHVAILDRFRQIEPKLLISQDGYVHGGKMISRRDVLDTIIAGLPSLENVAMVCVADSIRDDETDWHSLTQDDIPFQPTQVPFEHPLWVVYSSGTTGNPKPIVHGHGGVLIESAKQTLHQDLTSKDRFSWLTSSGWIMWNAQFMAMGQGASVAMFDGAPNHPDLNVVWEFVAREQVTYFGVGAAFVTTCAKAGVTPSQFDLSHLRSMGATGSPLTEDGYDWVYSAVKSDLWLAPISGGTDLCGAFVGGHPMLPVRAGQMQCRFLGNAVRAFDEAGSDLIGQVGELVCTEPLPSMPLYFWGDEDGSRLHESYFDTYPGIWRHGDWIEITQDGGAVIYGRSDATINRKGLRMGSAELYQAVEGLDAILDSLVVDLEFLGRDSFMPLFVVLGPGQVLDDALKEQINQAIRTAVSARFVPNEIVQIGEVPRTLSGKKLEVPVKKLLLGGDPDRVVNRDSMINPDSFDAFIAYEKNMKKAE